MKKIVTRVILGGIVVHEGKVLIIQRSSTDDVFPGLWELPSGKKEPLEPVLTGLVREVFEETKLKVKPVEPIGVFNFQVEKPDEIRDATEIDFLVSLDGPANVKLSDEHQGFAWITKKDLDKYNLSKETKSMLLTAFNKINFPPKKN